MARTEFQIMTAIAAQQLQQIVQLQARLETVTEELSVLKAHADLTNQAPQVETETPAPKKPRVNGAVAAV